MSKRSSDFSGWMFKEGKRVKNWKQRWFELRGDKLQYYEQKNGDKPIFTIILTKYAKLEVLHDDDAPHDNMFLLQTQDRDWKFSVERRNERDAWMTHLMNNLPNYTRRSTAISATTLTARDALTEGYLQKTGKWNTNWKKRWCQLYPKEKKLRYYIVSEDKKTFKDKINLGHVTAIARVNSKGHPHGFVLVTRGRRYKFAADTAEDLEKWWSAISPLVGGKQESSLRDKQGLLQTLLTLNYFPMVKSKRGNIFLPDWLWHEVSDMMGNIEAPQTEDEKGDEEDYGSEGFICRPGLILHLLQDTTTLSFDAAMKLLEDSRQSFLLKPLLIDIQGPIYIIGQLNGDFDGLINIFETLGTPPATRYLFLGNIICGKQSLSVALLLLAMKVHYPEHLYIIRGKMEDQIHSRAPKGSLYDECKKQFETEDGRELWKEFVWLFDHMPICAVLNKTLFAVASGLSQNIIEVDALRTGKIRPLYIARTNGKKYPPGRLIGSVIVRDFIYNIPVEGRISYKKQSNDSDKGLVYYHFGKGVLNNFLNKNRFTKVIRTGPVNMTDAVFRLGHTTFAENRLISISSSANYNSVVINNKFVKGAVMFLEETGEDFTFHTFKPDC